MRYPFNSKNRVTQPWSGSHYGLDIVGAADTRVCAVCAGTVMASTMITNKKDRTWEWGNYVRVDGTDGKRYFYCHLSSRAVKVGQRVAEGDIIGVMGNTGHSFGAHLHLQVRTAQNVEVNVARVIDMPNRIGTYIEATRAQAHLWLATAGPVSRGDRAQYETLAKEMQVKCIINTQGCSAGLCRCIVGPVSKGDLARVQALAAKQAVPCIATEV